MNTKRTTKPPRFAEVQLTDEDVAPMRHPQEREKRVRFQMPRWNEDSRTCTLDYKAFVRLILGEKWADGTVGQ